MFFEETNHSYAQAPDEELEEAKKVYPLYTMGAIRLQPENLLLPSIYINFADDIYNYKFHDGDVLVAGYPKSGTTWMQEIAWTMVNNPNLDSEHGKEELYIRSPMFELDITGGVDMFKTDTALYEKLKKAYPDIEDSSWLETLKTVKDRRVIKSHLCPSVLSPTLLKNAKTIYTIRDPRDICVSLYHMLRSMAVTVFEFKGDLEEIVRISLSGNGVNGDMANYIRIWLPYKTHKNVHFVFYENLKMDTANELKKLDEFLGTGLTPSQLDKIKNHVSFNQMKKQDTFLNASKENRSKFYNDKAEETGGFYRKGIVGDFKEKFSPKINEIFNEYLRKEFKDLNLEYQYEEYQA